MSDNRVIANAVERWSEELIDIGGRNRLLFYKPMRSGTIDFRPNDDAAQDVTERLLGGQSVRLSEAFPAYEDDPQVMRRGRTIHQKAREHVEEQGIRTLYVGRYFASWTDKPGREPAAPLFLSAAEIKPLGRLGDDFELQRIDDWELNPSLLHYLRTEFQVEWDEEALEGVIDEERWDEALGLVEQAAAEVVEFEVVDRVVLGTFSYAKLPLVRDLQDAHEAIGQHELVAALTGDPASRDRLRSIPMTRFGKGPGQIPDDPPPQDEFLILDADGSQSRVINAVLQGRNLLVSGPPGTGKSQTIANLIAALTARGKSTLFVAEKRAAIDAVTKRLNQVGLGDLVLDLHEGVRSRRQTAEELKQALDTVRTSVQPRVDENQRHLNRTRDELSNASDALHEQRDRWGVSEYELILLLQKSNEQLSSLPVKASDLRALTATDREQHEQELRTYLALGGGALDVSDDSPWSALWQAGGVNDQREADEIRSTVEEAEVRLLEAERLVAAAGRAGHDALLRDVGSVLDALSPASGGWIHRVLARLLKSSYRQAIREGGRMAPGAGDSPQVLHNHLENMKSSIESCGETVLGDPSNASPTRSISTEQVSIEWSSLMDVLHRLLELTQSTHDAAQLGWSDYRRLTAGCRDDIATLLNIPELRGLRSELERTGTLPLAQFAATQGWAVEEALSLLTSAWAQAVFEEMRLQDRGLAQLDAVSRDDAVAEFCGADQEHILQGAGRVRRRWAEAVIAARNAHPEQEELIVRQSKLKRRHKPMRDLVREAPDVLTALKPCWAMSPLVVPQILPRVQLLDVVIFDEASQVLPADAVPSLLRGRQAVIAGDSKQMPPTTFFTSTNEDAEEDDGGDELGPLTSDVESILDAVSALMPANSRTLGWHYRSKDERLIGFSNHHIYDGALTTFPGVLGDDCLTHVEVPFGHDAVAAGGSNSAEVARVVELILEHALLRPDESLGVIAFGLKHAQRIEEALRLARRERPDLDEFFGDGQEEPFFVKNLERVQGDERDAIILTVGYGRTDGGRMRYNFGPLNQEGGYRRLNVAVTRAKRRMTVVSAFSAADMDPDRLRSQGPRMLRDYIAYAASAGREFGSVHRDTEPLNPFELDIKDRLEAAGIPLEAQFGASGYWIDFAAMHPERPGQPVLAIEADGARYHSAINARERDRLRQEFLERLGWRFHRIWSTEWFRNPEAEVAKCVQAWQQAVAAAANEHTTPASSSVTTQTAPTRAAPIESVPARQGACPHVNQPGRPITEYSDWQLDDIVRWGRSDGLLHTNDELIRDIAKAMGYKQVGSRIRARLEHAISRVG